MKIATRIFIAIAGTLSAAEVTLASHQEAPFIAKDMVPEVVGFMLSFSSEIGKEDKRNKAIETFWARA